MIFSEVNIIHMIFSTNLDFDQKINNENLTKCLQTLKHMYYDLSIKNVFCCNEAEFRAFDVLLHLNDGDILRFVFMVFQN